jgi:hypothetical protein
LGCQSGANRVTCPNQPSLLKTVLGQISADIEDEHDNHVKNHIKKGKTVFPIFDHQYMVNCRNSGKFSHLVFHSARHECSY